MAASQAPREAPQEDQKNEGTEPQKNVEMTHRQSPERPLPTIAGSAPEPERASKNKDFQEYRSHVPQVT